MEVESHARMDVSCCVILDLALPVLQSTLDRCPACVARNQGGSDVAKTGRDGTVALFVVHCLTVAITAAKRLVTLRVSVESARSA